MELSKKEYLLKDRTYGSKMYNNRLLKLFGLGQAVPTDKTLGNDISHWNGLNNFFKMYQKGMRFSIFKGTDVGSATRRPFTDDKASINYKNAKANKLFVGSYCWLDPKYDAEIQAEYYLNNIYFKFELDFPAVLDFEDRNVYSYSDMLYKAQKWLEIVEKRTNKIPIVYTSPGYMASFDKSKCGFLSEYDLWVAHYIQRNYPTIPYPWNKYLMWQYSDRGNYPYYIYPAIGFYGKDWGSGSFYLDMIWFNGTYLQLINYLDVEDEPTQPIPVEPPTPIEPPVPITKIFEAVCTAWYLNIRNGPNTTYQKIDYLKKGDKKIVYKVSSNNWYKISEDEEKWVSGTYMKKIKDIIIPEPPTEEEILFQAECIVNALNVRNGVGISNNILYQIKKGDIINVYEEKDNWFRIRENGQEWCSGYLRYMKKIKE